MKLIFIAFVGFYSCASSPEAKKKIELPKQEKVVIKETRDTIGAGAIKSKTVSWCNESNDSLNLKVTMEKRNDTVFISYGVVMLKGTLLYSTPDEINHSGYFLEKDFSKNTVVFRIKNEYFWQNDVYYNLKLSLNSKDSSLLWQVKSANIDHLFPVKVFMRPCRD